MEATEIASRHRVLTGPQDPRLQEEKFTEAVVIVANNDVRTQINKDRAEHWATAKGRPFRYAHAIDRPSNP
eukprot:6736932-Prorocentrum_lima.AAC.1